jgi:Protein of unknown function (DUF3617)
MGAFRTALLLVVVGVIPASAADFPMRKAGLWEITTSVASHSIKMQQCTDAKTDQAMQAHAGSAPQGDCSKRDVQKSGATTTIDAVCTFGGKTMTSHIVVTGSFDSEYTLTMTSQAEGMPVGNTATLNAKWLGPCAADQKPGDMILPNGMKLNIQNLPNLQRKG